MIAVFKMTIQFIMYIHYLIHSKLEYLIAVMDRILRCE